MIRFSPTQQRLERDEPLPPTGVFPTTPTDLEGTGVGHDDLRDLTLRLASTMPSITTDVAADRLCLPKGVVAQLLEELREDRKVESLGSTGPLTFLYAITDHGREQAKRLFDYCGYVGPAPVSLDQYRRELERQFRALPEVTPAHVATTLDDMVLDEKTREVLGLACVSGRTLLVYGPPGNGKTEVGHRLHRSFSGDLWIPHALSIDGKIVRMFDPQVHEPFDGPSVAEADPRWVHIKRPFVVVGGELTMESLELAFDSVTRCYEAPMHFKANGGTFLLDDFGCQRAEPSQLLSRWVYPLEHHEDLLTMRSGQKIRVPFRQMLIVSTSQDPEELMEPAFLRRMGYRVLMNTPTVSSYRRIFTRYAERCGAQVDGDILTALMERYEREGRRPTGCEPRDLIERARDICRFRGQALELTPEVLDRAWTGYFGTRMADAG